MTGLRLVHHAGGMVRKRASVSHGMRCKSSVRPCAKQLERAGCQASLLFALQVIKPPTPVTLLNLLCGYDKSHVADDRL